MYSSGVYQVSSEQGKNDLNHTKEELKKSYMDGFLVLVPLAFTLAADLWEFILLQLHFTQNKWKFRLVRLLAQDYS